MPCRKECLVIITNPFKNDIRLLFEEEYNIALKSVGYINDRLNITINDDEISYITLHIHSARSDMKISESILMATVINESLKEIEDIMHIHIDSNSLSYNLAKGIIKKLSKALDIRIDDMEIGYLAIHIERICTL